LLDVDNLVEGVIFEVFGFGDVDIVEGVVGGASINLQVQERGKGCALIVKLVLGVLVCWSAGLDGKDTDLVFAEGFGPELAEPTAKLF
jgi:hypothetical protein